MENILSCNTVSMTFEAVTTIFFFFPVYSVTNIIQKANFFCSLPIIASFRKSSRWRKILKNGRGKYFGACLNKVCTEHKETVLV